MSNISISACVLTYNGKDRVIPTLESLKLQTYPHKELIIADDASTDSGHTVSIIEGWLKNNSKHFNNVHFIENPHNLGIVANIKNAVSFAKGEIIYLLGQGDMCYGPDTFSQIAEEIEKQRNNGLEDPYFWLGQYMGYTINNDVFKPIQLYKDLPHQHKLITTNPHKALRINLRKWEIGGVGVVYNAKFYKDENFPLFEAPRNWEDGPTFLWALIEGHRIGTLPIMLRWYEVGTGISWEINRKSKREKIIRLYNRIFGKLNNNYVNPNSEVNQIYIRWFESLSPFDKEMESIKEHYILYMKTNEKHLNCYLLLILGLKRLFELFIARLRQYYSVIIFSLCKKHFININNKPFSKDFLNGHY